MIVARAPGEMSRDDKSVVTVGTFDGVHRAHAQILEELVRRARNRSGRAVVITFDPHPKEVVASPRGDVRLLTTLAERLDRIGRAGIDLVYVIRFDREFSLLPPREFYERHVVSVVGVAEVVVGYDHMFGRDRQGGRDELVMLAAELGFSVDTVSPILVDGEPVSSTKVRHALVDGDVARATRLLGYPYSLEGTVVRGDGRGRVFGVPTANIVPQHPRKLVPGRGVYCVGVRCGEERWFGMMNIGVRPTVTAETTEVLEVNIFGVDRDLYGRTLRVVFLRRLREERRFGSSLELKEQLNRDRDEATRMVKELNAEELSHAW